MPRRATSLWKVTSPKVGDFAKEGNFTKSAEEGDFAMEGNFAE